MEDSQRQYELVCILHPQLDEDDLENTKREIEETINKIGGTISFKESEKRELAYPINKQGQGIFLSGQVSILAENVANLSKELKLNKQILRHLINQVARVKAEFKRKIKPKKIIKKQIKKIEEKKEKETKVKLEEIDKRLDEIIEEI